MNVIDIQGKNNILTNESSQKWKRNKGFQNIDGEIKKNLSGNDLQNFVPIKETSRAAKFILVYISLISITTFTIFVWGVSTAQEISNEQLICNLDCLMCIESPNNCTSCDLKGLTPYYKPDTHQCLDNCSDYYYLDNVQKYCLQCQNFCQVCNNNESCIICQEFYYFDSAINQCMQCDSSCLTCSGPNNDECLSCDEDSQNYIFNQNKNTCNNKCQDGYFQNKSQCYQCNKECLQCTGNSNNECLSCNQTSQYPYYTQDLNTCSYQCQINYYLNQNQCEPCDSTCLKCNGPQNNQCLLCALSGLYPYFNSKLGTCSNFCGIQHYLYSYQCFSCDSSCQNCNDDSQYNCTSCYDTYYLEVDNTCNKCNSICLTCNGGQKNNCLSCISNSINPYYNQYLQTCSSNCVDGYYLNYNLNQCQKCYFSCTTCIGGQMTNCTTCNISSIYKYYNVQLQTCTIQCQNGYYPNINNCEPCSTNCQTCSGPSKQECLSCNQNSQTPLYTSNLSICTTKCNDGYFQDQDQCILCSSQCLTCNGGTFQQCLSCSSNYYLSQQNQCILCYYACMTCSGPSSTNCQSCDQAGSNPYFNSILQTCSFTCANGYYLNSQFCLVCNKVCLTCNGSQSNNCLSCNKTSIYPYFTNEFGTCTSTCPNGFYLNLNQCLRCNQACITCTSGTISDCLTCSGSNYLNTLQNLCQPCDISCKTCTGPKNNQCINCLINSLYPLFNQQFNTCTQTCINGFYKSNFNCLICDQSCLTCTGGSSSNCINCNQSSYNKYYTSNLQICTASCTNGYYLNSMTCQKCDITCFTCQNGSNNSCILCDQSGQYPYFNALQQTCSSKCLNGYYLNQYTCQLCNSTCLTCNGGSSSNCLTCNTSSKYPYYTSTIGTCTNSCLNSYYLNNQNQCLQCFSQCYSCNAGTNQNCTKCSIGQYPYFNSILGTCSSSCTAGYYPNNYQCYPCNPSCATCNNSKINNCLSCNIQGTNPYYTITIGTCSNQCLNGYYLSQNICYSCDLTCFTCQAGTSTSCLSCNQTSLYKYLNTYLKTCTQDCQIGYYLNLFSCNPCDPRCFTCNNSTSNDCQSCDEQGKYPYFNNFNNSCEINCPQGQYIYLKKCLLCDFSCQTCNAANNQSCLSCDSGSSYQYYNPTYKTCTENCVNGYYGMLNICYQCDKTCLTCYQQYNCSSCSASGSYPNYNIYLGTCSVLCASGFYLNQNLCLKCDSTCATCVGGNVQNCTSCNTTSLSKYYNSVKGTCTQQCIDGFYLKSYLCLICDSTCLTCNGSLISNCLSCNITSQYPYYNSILGNCSSACADGYYLNSNQCLVCNSQCDTCGGTQQKCTSCKTTSLYIYYNSVQGTCTQQCVDGFYSNSHQCLICDSTCLTCNGSFISNCLSCNITSQFPYYNSILGNCSSACADGYYLNSNQCLVCNSQCDTCEGTQQNCTSCKTPSLYIYYNQLRGTCTQSCVDGFYSDQLLCLICDSTCLTCNGSLISNCLSCNITSQYPYQNSILGNCTSACTDGYYQNSNQCLICDSSCQTCDGQLISNCLSCDTNSQYPNYNFILGTCSQICDQGYYLNSNQCLQCDSTCGTCDAGTNFDCKTCSFTGQYPIYNFWTKTCNVNCANGFYQESYFCLICDTTCYTCNGQLASNCLSCDPTSSYPYYTSETFSCSSSCDSEYYIDEYQCILSQQQ